MPESAFSMLPFRDVPDFAIPIVFAVGLTAINWGKMELHLEMLLRQLNKDELITGPMEKFPDTSFRIKAQLFAKWYAKHPRFKATHAIAAPMIPALKTVNKSRVRLFHSNVQAFSEGPPATMDIQILEAKGEDIIISKGSWTAEAILHFSGIIAHISDDFAKISQIAMTESFRESLRKG